MRQGSEVNLSKFYKPRPREARKGDYGRVVVAGGSDRYAGCLAFNALAALRAGADLSIVVAPRRAADIVAGYSPDLITVPCKTPFPDPGTVREVLKGSDALVLGCGVVRSQAAHNALLTIMRECTNPIVADAEALHAIATKPEVLQDKQALLTPNAGEFQVLSKQTWPTSNKERSAAIMSLARQYRATIIVKGAEDYISDGSRVFVDPQGSPYLTKGGYGDLLAGVAGAVLARGYDTLDAARTAAMVVGKAGEIASNKLGEGTLASDTLDEIPFALSQRRG
jgi:ADP-dependent NAD(P)H-hydrate dehydratase / NAD(P)H-hydrate epimerase